MSEPRFKHFGQEDGRSREEWRATYFTRPDDYWSEESVMERGDAAWLRNEVAFHSAPREQWLKDFFLKEIREQDEYLREIIHALETKEK
jgi:hypothetical protein